MSFGRREFKAELWGNLLQTASYLHSAGNANIADLLE